VILPEVSRFFGIIIKMYFNEHNPPHFHVSYNDFEAQFDIEEVPFVLVLSLLNKPGWFLPGTSYIKKSFWRCGTRSSLRK